MKSLCEKFFQTQNIMMFIIWGGVPTEIQYFRSCTSILHCFNSDLLGRSSSDRDLAGRSDTNHPNSYNKSRIYYLAVQTTLVVFMFYGLFGAFTG